MSTSVLDATLQRELDAVPDSDAFLGPDELSVQLSAIAARAGLPAPSTIGRSREGRPIECLTVGDGPRAALVFGTPHPNEPIGGLTTLHLARELAADRALGLASAYRWYIVPCVDPDGLALNSGWLRGPFDLSTYARNFYRPAGDEQVEWSFPFTYKRASFEKPLPETEALMELIDDVRPALMCSLHNSELGGAYYYLSRPQPGLHTTLQAIPKHFGLGLHAGEAEAPYIQQIDSGIYLWPEATASYDHAEALGLDPLTFMTGSSSSTYAARHGTLTLVSELPYWRDPLAGDRSPSGTTYATALRQQADAIEEVVILLRRGLEAVGCEAVAPSPFLRATSYFARALDGMPIGARRRADDAVSRREATMAELRSLHDVAHSFRLRYVGMLRRGLETLPDGLVDAALSREVEQRHEAWLADASEHTTAEPLPIRLLVGTQYGATLAAADHLATQAVPPATVL